MPATVRKGDKLNTGHGCDVITELDTPIQGSVYCNNILVGVKGTPTVPHLTVPHLIPAPPICVTHTAHLNQGSPNVFAEGIEVGRVTDSADAGNMISGSPDVYTNG